METILVKPWGAGQGDHVIINAADFDPAVHELLYPPAHAAETTEGEQGAASTNADASQAAAPAAATRKRRTSTAHAAETTEG